MLSILLISSSYLSGFRPRPTIFSVHTCLIQQYEHKSHFCQQFSRAKPCGGMGSGCRAVLVEWGSTLGEKLFSDRWSSFSMYVHCIVSLRALLTFSVIHPRSTDLKRCSVAVDYGCTRCNKTLQLDNSCDGRQCLFQGFDSVIYYNRASKFRKGWIFPV
jgi:hypothetical protein